MTKSEVTLSKIILALAVGVFLAVGGIWALQGGGDGAANAIRAIFSGDLKNIFIIVFGVIELLAGIFILLRLFVPSGFGTLGSILIIIVAAVWLFAIVMSDILGANGILNGGAKNFLRWIYELASHLIIFGAILAIR